MESFVIYLEGEEYPVTAIADHNGKMTYQVKIAPYQILEYVGNPNWDRGGPELVPKEPYLGVDLDLLEGLAEQLENRFK